MDHKIEFHLKELMESKGYSKSRLSRETGLRFETIQGYYLGSISRIDLFVLTQFCEVFSCQIQDIITYNPKKKS